MKRGNSGGPLVSLYGYAIGVNTMIADTGLGFAVPIDQVQRFIKAAKHSLAEKQSNMKRSKSATPAQTSPQQRPRRSNSWFGFGGGDSGATEGETRPRFLGLVVQTLTPDLTADLVTLGVLRGPIDTQAGVYIHGVMRDSPADR